MNLDDLAALLREKIRITGDGNIIGKDNTVSVIKQTAADVAIQIGQVNLTLSLADLQRLLLTPSRQSVSLYQKEKADIPFTNITLKELVSHLNEWKTVHSIVQSLLLNTSSIASQIKYELTEQVISSVEIAWLKHCEPKVKQVETYFEFQYIKHDRINDLMALLNRNRTQYVLRCIWLLDLKDITTIRRLRRSIYELMGTLEEVLILADLYIVEITESLIRQLN